MYATNTDHHHTVRAPNDQRQLRTSSGLTKFQFEGSLDLICPHTKTQCGALTLLPKPTMVPREPPPGTATKRHSLTSSMLTTTDLAHPSFRFAGTWTTHPCPSTIIAAITAVVTTILTTTE